MCSNQRCIPHTLRCDGFNQCGDNSDEPDQCELGEFDNGQLELFDSCEMYFVTQNGKTASSIDAGTCTPQISIFLKSIALPI